MDGSLPVAGYYRVSVARDDMKAPELGALSRSSYVGCDFGRQEPGTLGDQIIV